LAFWLRTIDIILRVTLMTCYGVDKVYGTVDHTAGDSGRFILQLPWPLV